MKAQYVYMLRNENGRYYVGVSNDVRRRMAEHNAGLSKATMPFRPFRLVRVEKFVSIKEAYAREHFLKSKKSRRILNLIVASSPDVLAEQEAGIPILRSKHLDSVGRVPKP